MSSHKDVTMLLDQQLKRLRLPAFRECYQDSARRAEKETLSYEHYLLELATLESEHRRDRRIARLLHDSKLPLEKALETFDMQRLPVQVARQVRTLQDGSFLDRRENILAFGRPGSGKTHLLCGLAQELIRSSARSIYFTTCSKLVQQLLTAKQELKLNQMLTRLSRYDGILIDDIGYVQQSREEMEVLFTLLADRYERGSILLTSNLPFSKWESIFKDAMTTAAAIDRLVHHSVILELNLTSYRLEQAKRTKRQTKRTDTPDA